MPSRNRNPYMNDEETWLDEYEKFYLLRDMKKENFSDKFLKMFWEGWDKRDKETGEVVGKTKGFLIAYIVAMIACLFGFGFQSNVLISILGLVIVVLAIVGLVKMRQAYNAIEELRLPPNELDMIWVLIHQAGIVNIRDHNYSDWKVWDNTDDICPWQLKFRIRCDAPGVDIISKQRQIETACKQYTWNNGHRAYNVYFIPAGGSDVDVIVDTRNPKEQTSELYDFLLQGNGLPEWHLPRNEKGNLNGQIAMGAVDLGLNFGKVDVGFLYGHHFGISGISGYGKSNAVHFLLWQLAQYPNVQILYIDPNETDGELWGNRACVVGRKGATAALEAVQQECERRAEIMKKNKWAKWQSSPAMPQLVVVVDEVKFLMSQEKDAKKKMEDLLAISRKYGITFILGTQYPKKEYIGGAWENLHFKMSSRLNSDIESQVVFGAQANLAPCAKIETQGTFYCMNDKNKVERLHVPYVSEKVVLDMASRTAKLKDDNFLKRFGNVVKKQQTEAKRKSYGF